MKLFKNKIVVILLLLPLLTIANTGKRTGKHTKEKTIHEEFTVNKNTKLEIWNNYGNVDITTWEGNSIIVDTQIIVNGNNEQNVTAALKQIYLDFNSDDSKKSVKVETKGLEEIKQHKEIHYQIKVPKTCPLLIINSYGNIIINETDANVNLTVSYGNVLAGKLNGESSVWISYSQKTKIKLAKNLTISTFFSDLKIDEAEELFIKKMQSSNVSIGEVWSLTYSNCNYGTLDIDSILWGGYGNGDYLTVNIKSITGRLPMTFNAKYGSINIGKWDNKNTAFDVYGTRLSLGYSNEIPFDINLNVKGCIIPTTVRALPKTVQDNLTTISEKEYSGYHIKKETGRKLSIKITKGILRFNNVDNQ